MVATYPDDPALNWLPLRAGRRCGRDRGHRACWRRRPASGRGRR